MAAGEFVERRTPLELLAHPRAVGDVATHAIAPLIVPSSWLSARRLIVQKRSSRSRARAARPRCRRGAVREHLVDAASSSRRSASATVAICASTVSRALDPEISWSRSLV